MKIRITSELGRKTFDKIIKKAIQKSIKRANRINTKKRLDYFGEFIEEDKDTYYIKLAGDPAEVEKDIKKIKSFLQDRLGFIQKTDLKLWAKIRMFAKRQLIQRAYILMGIELSPFVIEEA